MTNNKRPTSWSRLEFCHHHPVCFQACSIRLLGFHLYLPSCSHKHNGFLTVVLQKRSDIHPISMSHLVVLVLCSRPEHNYLYYWTLLLPWQYLFPQKSIFHQLYSWLKQVYNSCQKNEAKRLLYFQYLIQEFQQVRFNQCQYACLLTGLQQHLL